MSSNGSPKFVFDSFLLLNDSRFAHSKTTGQLHSVKGTAVETASEPAKPLFLHYLHLFRSVTSRDRLRGSSPERRNTPKAKQSTKRLRPKATLKVPSIALVDIRILLLAPLVATKPSRLLVRTLSPLLEYSLISIHRKPSTGKGQGRAESQHGRLSSLMHSVSRDMSIIRLGH